jgi:hypothetical protein
MLLCLSVLKRLFWKFCITPFEYRTQRAVTLPELREWYDKNLVNMPPARWINAQALVICKFVSYQILCKSVLMFVRVGRCRSLTCEDRIGPADVYELAPMAV